jgi:hypothetical protein
MNAELETPRPATGSGFSDAVTFSFGDERHAVYGMARVGLADGAGTGLALLFSGRETVAARAASGEPAASFEDVRAAGVSTALVAPLERWTVSFSADEGGFALEFEAIGAPAPAVGGGMEGYEQLCRVTGTVTVGGQTVTVECLGQRGHQWGRPDWDKLGMARSLGAWLSPQLAVVAGAFRQAKAKDHAREEIDAVVLDGAPLEPIAIADPLFSTAYDADGHQRRIGWELWPVDEEAPARRGAGEVLCGTSLDLGRLTLDCAFFRFRMEGREGVGRFDVLRRN